MRFKINGHSYGTGCYADGSVRDQADCIEAAQYLVDDIDPNWTNPYQSEYDQEPDNFEIADAYEQALHDHLTSLCPDGIWFGYCDNYPGDVGFYCEEED